MNSEQTAIVILVLQQGVGFAALVLMNVLVFYFGKIILGMVERDLERQDDLAQRLLDIVDRNSGQNQE